MLLPDSLRVLRVEDHLVLLGQDVTEGSVEHLEIVPSLTLGSVFDHRRRLLAHRAELPAKLRHERLAAGRGTCLVQFHKGFLLLLAGHVSFVVLSEATT